MLTFDTQTPQKSLNKAYRKEKVARKDIDRLKAELPRLLDLTGGDDVSESTLRDHLQHFLREVWYPKQDFLVQSEVRRMDTVIHDGPKKKDPIGVIVEAKTRRNSSEMWHLRTRPNSKALHELVLYFMREREAGNTGIKTLVITNGDAIYLFADRDFERLFWEKKRFRKQLLQIDADGGKTNEQVYEHIRRHIAELDDKVTVTEVQLSKVRKYCEDGNADTDDKLIPLYKALSPVHLLRRPFANDSNKLDKAFYRELLHIIGLEEVSVDGKGKVKKSGGKKIIRRLPPGQRHPASLLENVIDMATTDHRFRRLPDFLSYGSNREEREFAVAIELCITWINRVLFLKLLESQLVSYHPAPNPSDGSNRPTGAAYRFLTPKLVPDYDGLHTLFFKVLAVRPGERQSIVDHFHRVPYLNSSLFEPTELESQVLFVHALKDQFELPYHPNSVLRRKGSAHPLHYLFDFLDAYDFGGGGGAIQEENKRLINASVLGLIFEKINGYKDGSFYTPGFITEYMCRETIRRAVVQKFRDDRSAHFADFDAESFADLCHFLSRKYRSEELEAANAVVNSVTVCDPAVGSGHFLVSALNELIAVKAELGILGGGAAGAVFNREVQASVENDELLLTYRSDGRPFEYHVREDSNGTLHVDDTVQTVQRTLFDEKRTLIENCLFGVDINPNSVKICRLRLWIELLKHAYYRVEGEASSPFGGRGANAVTGGGERTPPHGSLAPKGGSTAGAGADEPTPPPGPLSPKGGSTAGTGAGERTPPHGSLSPKGGSTAGTGTGEPTSLYGPLTPEGGSTAGRSQLETLPNIDINIKQGNSLVSRFALDDELKEALADSPRFRLDSYRIAVAAYHRATGPEEKQGLLRVIDEIKGNFQSHISRNDKKVKALAKARGRLDQLQGLLEVGDLFGSVDEKKVRKEIAPLKTKVEKLETEIESVRSNAIYRNAFEWRFEFPAVLGEDGEFLGFDVVVGNPPYIRQEELGDLKGYLEQSYEVYAGTADLLVYFIELSMKNLRNNGQFSFIISNKFMRAGFGRALRRYLKQFRIVELIDFGDLPVFDGATTYPLIISLEKKAPADTFVAMNVPGLETQLFREQLAAHRFTSLQSELTEEGWNLADVKTQRLLEKLRNTGVPLGEYVKGEIYYGIKTGYNEAFVIDADTRDRLIAEDPKSAVVIKPFLAGRDVKRYVPPVADKYLILFKKGWTYSQGGPAISETVGLALLKREYPAVAGWLMKYEDQAKKRYDKGDFWWELRACDYYGEFEKPKIFYQEIMTFQSFTLDVNHIYSNNKLFIIPNGTYYTLGILNSLIIWFILRNTATTYRGGAIAMQSPFILSLPIVYDLKYEQTIDRTVNRIIEIKSQNPQADTTALEAEIDLLVYHLYGLSYEEVLVVDPEFGLSEEEYLGAAPEVEAENEEHGA
ncbi:Eco57I restriction-modification methylase domain-containing protein [Lewinella sp. JB7]|uniref:type IIG restriction enzyme/methyltransferase n=1 Tax=Lewinella sp. JB7 TaxID=2962887 RepID=UPI0020CA048E|nr:TaqI-like C-terminal specificity domain-containing protein [Lewinella sp. JB7]MCP9237719.1 Eco57I restriction-modification methylase domain-containing protein [Lewinella sp. JB7]